MEDEGRWVREKKLEERRKREQRIEKREEKRRENREDREKLKMTKRMENAMGQEITGSGEHTSGDDRPGPESIPGAPHLAANSR
jgi:hypothetical protein